MSTLSKLTTRMELMLNSCQSWRDWAGADYEDKVFYTENRSQIENGRFISQSIELVPNSILWVQSMEGNPQQCLWSSVSGIILFQDNVTPGKTHNESWIEFSDSFGAVMDEMLRVIQSPPPELLVEELDGDTTSIHFNRLILVQPPERTSVTNAGAECDVITAVIGLVF